MGEEESSPIVLRNGGVLYANARYLSLVREMEREGKGPERLIKCMVEVAFRLLRNEKPHYRDPHLEMIEGYCQRFRDEVDRLCDEHDRRIAEENRTANDA